MLKSFYLVSFVFLIFLITSLPVHAYASVDINKTTAGYINNGPNKWFSGLTCTNITGTFYCYILGHDTSANILLEKYNYTLDFVDYCDTNTSDTLGTSSINGVAIANSTHLSIPLKTGIYWLTSMSDCSSNAYGTHTAVIADYMGAGFYYSNTDSGINYWGSPIRALVNSTTGDVLSPGFWSIHDIKMSLPNQTDNITSYSIVEISTNFLEWINGVYNGYKLSLSDFYGVGPYFSDNYPFAWDLFKVDSGTTWIYWIGTDARIYRANFTAIPTASELIFNAVSPVNNATVSDNPPVLRIYLNSTLNGTLTYYLDEAQIGTKEFIGSNSSQDIYFLPGNSLDLGQHNWSAIYTLATGTNFSTGTQYFLEGSVDFFDNPALATALVVSGFFGVTDETASKDAFSLIASLVISIALIVLINVKSKKTDGLTSMAIFFGSFIIMCIIFYTVGFMSAWIPVTLIGALILISMLIAVKGK